MPVRDVQFVPDHYYHLYNRGVNRQRIFVDDQDYCDFLRRIKENTAKFQVAVIAYCLEANHFHFCLRQDGAVKVGMAVQIACNGYAQRFNLRHQRTGALFAGRFKAIPVTDDEYLHNLCWYIHGNPVKDNLALQPELWPYSNYLEWIGQRNGPLVDREFIATHFGTAAHYRQLLIHYLTHSPKLPEKLRVYLAGLDG